MIRLLKGRICWMVFLCEVCWGLAAIAAPHSPVQWHIKSAPAHPVKAAGKFEATLTGQVEPGWHLYALEEPDGGPLATEINLTDGDPADLERVSEGKPKFSPDPTSGKATGSFEGSVDFGLHMQMARDAAAGQHTLHVLIRFQSCNDKMCLPPHTDTVELPVVVAK